VTQPAEQPSGGIPAVFAVFAGIYQRAVSLVPQKSWSSGGAAEQGTADERAPDRCKSL
jgi:hypothetical protein